MYVFMVSDMITDKDKEWAEHYMNYGNASEASRETFPEIKAVAIHGSRMKAKMRNYIERNMVKFIQRHAPDAMETIIDLAKNCPDVKVRLAAAQDILNRAGVKSANRIEVSISDKSDRELNAEIGMLLEKGGIIDASPIE